MEAVDVLAALATDAGRGLTADDAAGRLLHFGPNELRRRRRRPPWLLFAEQFANAMILVLVAAAVVTAVIGDLKDTLVIAAIVVINGVIGFVQEFRAEHAMEALSRLTSPTARVLRDGQVVVISPEALVPGDVVRLDTGDVVTADLRLTAAQALRINESALTGESEPAGKTDAPLPHVPPGQLADQRNMAFSGTAVTYGRGSGVVVATGMATALGHVADLLQEHGSGQTPLQRRLGSLGRRLAVAALAVCAIVFTLGILRGEPPDVMFLTAVSLAVAAIPEGLPAVVTIALALGAHRMAARRALIRKLPAVETLGSVTVVCSDKTGTLTQNRMLVERVWTPRGEYRVSGDGYAPAGTIEPDPVGDEALHDLALVAASCNDAILHAPADRSEPWTITGDPTEGALLAMAAKAGVESADLAARRPRIQELPFDTDRRRMVTLHDDGGRIWVAVKGALEAIAPLVDPVDAAHVRTAEAVAARYASEGFRVLAFAQGESDGIPGRLEAVEQNLRLVGIAAMTDPPRPESEAAIAACRRAGVTPVMITGDHPLTAAAIARRIGILDGTRRILTGAQLDELDEPAFASVVAEVAVYARTSPEQKLRIVEAWSARGGVVAMTGDGVNDAPALKRADIGVAMGITGTEVSREAADMVLADDNFASIVAAIEEGRRIYDNIRRFVRYLLTTNSAEIWVMFLAPFAGLPLPLLAVQILWINLVTDGAPALALGVEPAEADTMRRPPRRPGESIFANGLWQQAIWVGLFMAAVTLGIEALALRQAWPWQTMVFTTLALIQLGNAVAVRSETRSALRLGLRSNPALFLAVGGTLVVQLCLVYLPALQPIFGTEPLSAVQLAIVLAAATLGFVAVELEKWFRRRRAGAQGHASESVARMWPEA